MKQELRDKDLACLFVGSKQISFRARSLAVFVGGPGTQHPPWGPVCFCLCFGKKSSPRGRREKSSLSSA